MENILEIKGLKKEYKDFSLHDISFSLPMDCITGFIGVNGAGKTTTLKETLLFPQLRNIGFEIPVILFLIVSLFLGVYLPVQYKFGYEKTKLFFVVLIMASPFVFAQSLKMKNSLNINIFENINPIFLLTGSLVISVLILTISSAISVKIFKQADLS